MQAGGSALEHPEECTSFPGGSVCLGGGGPEAGFAPEAQGPGLGRACAASPERGTAPASFFFKGRSLKGTEATQQPQGLGQRPREQPGRRRGPGAAESEWPAGPGESGVQGGLRARRALRGRLPPRLSSRPEERPGRPPPGQRAGACDRDASRSPGTGLPQSLLTLVHLPRGLNLGFGPRPAAPPGPPRPHMHVCPSPGLAARTPGRASPLRRSPARSHGALDAATASSSPGRSPFTVKRTARLPLRAGRTPWAAHPAS